MHKKERAQAILSLLKKNYPDSSTALHSTTSFQLLCAIILSAQCTDKQVNQVTPLLFKRFGTPQKMAKASIPAIEKIIFSTGFYHAKATYLKSMATSLLEKYNGKVPNTMALLLTLSGVGRKTANVLLSAAFGIHEGIAVDTHVQRITKRWHLTSQSSPEKIEQELMQFIPKKEWGFFSWATILHGRAVCFARKPQCNSCAFADICPSAFQFSKSSK